MKTNQFFYGTLLCLFLTLLSCNPQDDGVGVNPSLQPEGEPTVLGEYLGNPFSIENIQKALNNLQEKQSTPMSNARVLSAIQPSHIYVRFKPNDIDQLMDLYDAGYELWDVPFDYEIFYQGDFYQDPSIPADQITYLYTLIPTGYPIPECNTEILEYMYMFDENAGDERDIQEDPWDPDPENWCYDDYGLPYYCDTDPREYIYRKAARPKDQFKLATMQLLENDINPAELYNEAMRLSGHEEEVIEQNSGGRVMADYRPQGTLRVQDQVLNQNVPLRGVQVNARRWFKLAKTFTTADGNFTMDKTFRQQASILVKFKNGKAKVRGINDSILQIWQVVFTVRRNIGSFATTGLQNIQHTIQYSNNPHSNAAMQWVAATFMNTLHDMTAFCTANNLPAPPNNMNVWISSRITQAASAAMLSKITNTSDISKAIDIFLSSTPVTRPIALIKKVIQRYLPDITCRYGSSETVTQGTGDLSRTFFHELGHSVHYGKVGNNYWVEYIAAIVTNAFGGGSPYGIRTSSTAGIIATGESWGYFSGLYFNSQRYLSQNFGIVDRGLLENQIPDNSTPQLYQRTMSPPRSRGWIPYGMVWDLTDTGEQTAITGVNDQVNLYTIKKVFDAYQSDVKTIPTLRQRLLSQNSNLQLTQVNNLVASYGW